MKTFGAIVATAAIASAAAAPLTESQYQYLFSEFVNKYNKTYETKDIFQKLNTFKDNLNIVLEHNAKGDSTYTLGINEYADLTPAEFAQQMNMMLVAEDSLYNHEPIASVEEDLTVGAADWSTSIKNPVKNQGRCGSCWAFSSIGAVEYRHAIKNRISTANRFSEQQLVDCDNSNGGCNGGLMNKALTYLANNGVCKESSYPYKGTKGSCSGCGSKTSVPKPRQVSGGANGLRNEVSKGPVPIAVAASSSVFQLYKSGVLKTSACGTGLNHAVLAVGHGTSGGINYFKVRNSWGASWGNGGYILIADDDTCGMISSVNRGYAWVPGF